MRWRWPANWSTVKPSINGQPTLPCAQYFWYLLAMTTVQWNCPNISSPDEMTPGWLQRTQSYSKLVWWIWQYHVVVLCLCVTLSSNSHTHTHMHTCMHAPHTNIHTETNTQTNRHNILFLKIQHVVAIIELLGCKGHFALSTSLINILSKMIMVTITIDILSTLLH